MTRYRLCKEEILSLYLQNPGQKLFVENFVAFVENRHHGLLNLGDTREAGLKAQREGLKTKEWPKIVTLTL